MVERHLVVSPDPVFVAGELLVAALERCERPRLAIPGGSAVRALAGLGPLWPSIRLTWVDERCVPVGHPDSNRGEARRAGLLGPAAFELPLYLDGEGPEAACERVRAGLQGQFESALDVALLGMGEDGHVASLFPGRRIDGERVAAVRDSPKPPAERITLTLPMLQTARSVVLLAAGQAKRAALMRLLDGDTQLPASGLGSVTIVTDLGDLR